MIVVYGHSDDLVEVEGAGFDDEADGDSRLVFGNKEDGGVQVDMRYVTPGVWAATIQQLGDEVPIPWDIQVSNTAYTVRVEIDIPDDSTVDYYRESLEDTVDNSEVQRLKGELTKIAQLEVDATNEADLWKNRFIDTIERHLLWVCPKCHTAAQEGHVCPGCGHDRYVEEEVEVKEYIFNVEYVSEGTMIVEATSEEEAREKAKKFDCLHDEVSNCRFEDVDLDSCERNV
jgi:hypothetical protein